MGCTSGKPASGHDRPVELAPDGSTKEVDVYLAVNGSAGGLVAQQLLDMGVRRFEMRLGAEDDVVCWVNIFSLKGEERGARFEELAALSRDAGHDVRVVACGGDGTVKWVISCLEEVSALHVPIGVIPFGTGNDLSRVLGWGAKAPSPLIGTGMAALRARIVTIFEAEKMPLDVWNVTVTLREGAEARFVEVKDKKQVETHHGERSFSQTMINYFSIGADGQLMFAFEQNRKSSQLANKTVYAQKGAFMALSPPRRLGKFIEAAKSGPLASPEAQSDLGINEKDRFLLFLNIPSYGAGADPWRRSADARPGAAAKTGFAPQFVGDGKVEVLTVRSTSNVGLSLTTGSKLGMHRVKQGRDFTVTFKEGADVFFQVDGEALKACQAETVTVTHGYQVQLLRATKAKAHALPEGVEAPAPPTPAAAVSAAAVEATAAGEATAAAADAPTADAPTADAPTADAPTADAPTEDVAAAAAAAATAAVAASVAAPETEGEAKIEEKGEGKDAAGEAEDGATAVQVQVPTTDDLALADGSAEAADELKSATESMAKTEVGTAAEKTAAEKATEAPEEQGTQKEGNGDVEEVATKLVTVESSDTIQSESEEAE